MSNPEIVAVLYDVDRDSLGDYRACGMRIYRKNGVPLTDDETRLITAATRDDFEGVDALLETDIQMYKEMLEENLRIRQLDVAISLERAEIRALKERLRAIDEEAK